jgi:hypothetical protein
MTSIERAVFEGYDGEMDPPFLSVKIFVGEIRNARLFGTKALDVSNAAKAKRQKISHPRDNENPILPVLFRAFRRCVREIMVPKQALYVQV